MMIQVSPESTTIAIAVQAIVDDGIVLGMD